MTSQVRAGTAPAGGWEARLRVLVDRVPPGWGVGGLAIGLTLLPVLTWLNRGSVDANAAVLETPRLLFFLLGLGGLALWVGSRDRWLGLAVGWVALNTWRLPFLGALETALLFGVGAGVLTGLRGLLRAWHPVLRRGLLWVALVQVAYAALQWRGWDPLWPESGGQIHGFMGNANWLGAFLAMLLPLAPWGVALPLAGGVILSHSLLAAIAAGVGVAVREALRPWRAQRDRPRDPAWGRGVLAAAGLSAIGAGLVVGTLWAGSSARGVTQPGGTVAERLAIWRLAVADWREAGPILGLGPGQWYYRVPALQHATPTPGQGTHPWLYGQAHNDWLQWGYEHGLVGVGLLAGWLWSLRRLWGRQPALAGSVAALAVSAAGGFPFHVVHLAGPALVILGLALADTTEEVP